MSMRKFVTMIVWVAFGIIMAGLGFYVGTRQQHSTALIRAAREAMRLHTYAEQRSDAELLQHFTAALDSYSNALDAYTNGRGLNPEHRAAVYAARAEIDRYRASHRSDAVVTHP